MYFKVEKRIIAGMTRDRSMLQTVSRLLCLGGIGSFILTSTAHSLAASQLPPVPEKSREKTQLPLLFVGQRQKEVGNILEGDKPVIEWVLENRGSSDLVIERTHATCGCTVVKLSEEDKTIPPGGSITIQARFDSTGRRGNQSKSVDVYSNDPIEPTLKLRFSATVEAVFEVTPPSVVNLRGIRRGETSRTTIDFLPAPGRRRLKILSIYLPSAAPLTLSHTPFESEGLWGERVSLRVPEQVALGPLNVRATIKLEVDGLERERIVSIRGQIASDLTWQPRVIDSTRRPSRPGKEFAPVTIRASEGIPFDIVSANAGPLFDVDVKAVRRGKPRTQYHVILKLRDDAAPGPFGASLEIRTSSLDQPIIRVPVYGLVSSPIEVEPSIIVLRQDGTPAGSRRRVKIQAWPQVVLRISQLQCNHEAVTVSLDPEANQRYPHIRFINVELTGKLPPGKHNLVLSVTMNLKQGQVDRSRTLDIPVVIEAP